ncbi:lipopolysaccharide biosynthesis protein [Photobacterium sanguinicancri]|uniref:lipopolysaccharide biosynthesis protein n=1 Tax=Photobacterium sanguinicancri TaxID=875932 RepID=UPI003B968EED
MNLELGRRNECTFNRTYLWHSLITSKLVGLLLQPWVTQWLGTTEYGRLDVLITLITCLSLIVTFGIPDALCRFAHDSAIKRNELLSGALGVLLLICGGSSLLFITNITTIQDWLPGSPPLFSLYCLVVNLCLNAVCTVPLTKLRLAHKPKQFVTALLLFSFSQAILIVLLAPRYGINGIMAAGLLANLFNLSTYPLIYLALALSFKTPNTLWTSNHPCRTIGFYDIRH